MTKIAGSGSTSQRHGSADPDPDPPQNVMDPKHCFLQCNIKTTTGNRQKGKAGTEYHVSK